MAQHPYWRGQIRIALITLPVNLFTATKASGKVALHELERRTGERIRHKNVTDEGRAVRDEDIVKAFEFRKNEYVMLEKEEIEKVKLPSSDTLELTEFVDVGAIPPTYYERPYFVVPEGKAATEIYHVLCSALRSANKAGIGQISLYGHEQLCAVSALQNGMILEILRYPGELQDLPVLYTQPSPKVKSDYLALARQLIEKSAQPFDPSRYRDHYREALLELIEAKKEHRRPSFPAREKPEKVIDFMDALRRSLKENKKAKESSLPSKHTKPKSG